MRRMAAVFGLTVLLCLTAGSAESSPAAEVSGYAPAPTWALGTQQSTSTRAVAEELWACHGHADPPHSSVVSGGTGLVFDAYQDCTGTYDSQRVCVQLWVLDYFGTPSPVSTVACGSWTVAPHSYYGRSLSCAALGRGRVRYFTKSTTYADPPSGIHYSSGQSYSAYLC
jgi:hypothetical protein